MIRLAMLLAVGGMLALAPLPLDKVLGNKKAPAKAVQAKILKSKEFKQVVERAVKVATEGDEEGTFSQWVRVSIGQQLGGVSDDEDEAEDEADSEADDAAEENDGEEKAEGDEPDEDEPADEAGEMAALEPHPLDEDIKEGAKADAIIKALAKSKAFAAVIEKAVDNSEELPKGSAGPSFGQAVQVAISNDLLHVADEPAAPEDEAEAPPEAPESE